MPFDIKQIFFVNSSGCILPYMVCCILFHCRHYKDTVNDAGRQGGSFK